MLTLDQIKEKVYFEFRRAQTDAMHTERLGRIHVSDLIKPCMKNVIYKKLLPDTGMDTEDMRSLYFGQAVHNASMVAKEDKYHEIFLAYDYARDEPLTYDQAKAIPENDPKHLDIIYGSIDDLVKVNGEWVITDKKTTGSIDYFAGRYGKASESHVDQINRYRVLLQKCYDIDAKHGAVIYISNNVTREKIDKPTVHSFKLKPIDETLKDMIIKAKIIKESLEETKLPERTKCYLCDGMCPYASRCFSEDEFQLDR